MKQWKTVPGNFIPLWTDLAPTLNALEAQGYEIFQILVSEQGAKIIVRRDEEYCMTCAAGESCHIHPGKSVI